MRTLVEQGSYRNLPELPSKTVFENRKDPKLVERRREGLSVYLQSLLADQILSICDEASIGSVPVGEGILAYDVSILLYASTGSID